MLSARRPSGDPTEAIRALLPVAPMMGRAGEPAVSWPISSSVFGYDGEVSEKMLI
jgi:hypothetical protein